MAMQMDRTKALGLILLGVAVLVAGWTAWRAPVTQKTVHMQATEPLVYDPAYNYRVTVCDNGASTATMIFVTSDLYDAGDKIYTRTGPTQLCLSRDKSQVEIEKVEAEAEPERIVFQQPFTPKGSPHAGSRE